MDIFIWNPINYHLILWDMLRLIQWNGSLIMYVIYFDSSSIKKNINSTNLDPRNGDYKTKLSKAPKAGRRKSQNTYWEGKQIWPRKKEWWQEAIEHWQQKIRSCNRLFQTGTTKQLQTLASQPHHTISSITAHQPLTTFNRNKNKVSKLKKNIKEKIGAVS